MYEQLALDIASLPQYPTADLHAPRAPCVTCSPNMAWRACSGKLVASRAAGPARPLRIACTTCENAASVMVSRRYARGETYGPCGRVVPTDDRADAASAG